MNNNTFPQSVEIPSRHITNEPNVMPEVYSWLFPPVQKEIEIFMENYPMGKFLENVHPGLDNAHDGLFDAFCNSHPEIEGLNGYEFNYPLSGSSEGIFHFIAHYITHHPQTPLYALKDEYKGYSAFVESLGGKINILDEKNLLLAPKGVLLLSQPSARDGNIIPVDILASLIERHKVFLDLAYVGLVKRFDLDLTHENILAVVTSLSKPFGLYYYRIGMMWTRNPVPSLYGNRWFKNLHGIFLGEKIIKHFDGTMHEWVKIRQIKALKHINEEWGTCFEPSDVALLATMPKDKAPLGLEDQLKPFLRGDVYRICLTPLMMKGEGQ